MGNYGFVLGIFNLFLRLLKCSLFYYSLNLLLEHSAVRRLFIFSHVTFCAPLRVVFSDFLEAIYNLKKSLRYLYMSFHAAFIICINSMVSCLTYFFASGQCCLPRFPSHLLLCLMFRCQVDLERAHRACAPCSPLCAIQKNAPPVLCVYSHP